MVEIKYTLRELADFLSANSRGEANCVVTSIAPLDKAESGQISFLENPAYRQYLSTTKASIIILREQFAKETSANVIIADDPYLAYAKISSLFDDAPKSKSGIHPTAIIGEGCSIGSEVSIAPCCVIANGVTIKNGAQIGAHCFIDENAVIGENSKLNANVTVYHNVMIGQRAIIHSGVVIGSDGFGMANEKGVWRKIYQLGTVIIENDVEIGANTTIDRGALENTVIENGVKLDNQIQIGHNVRIGAHTAIAGCVGIAGSTRIGRHCMIGGGVGIAGHIEIADGTILTARSSIHKSITKPGIYASGIPAIPHRAWWRILNRLLQLDNIVNRLENMEKKYNDNP